MIKILIGEAIVLIASVFVFRSLWLLMDEYFGNAYLTVFLVIGLTLTVLGLIFLNNQVKCEMAKNSTPTNS
ncbi:MAG: hypothetical protein LBQ98_04360 [Nitrososphaerota archaeon]|nr:hypothetical protein [Nitrososphaerota archaeon]